MRTHRKLALAIFCFCMPSAAYAADPMIGLWRAKNGFIASVG